MVGSLPCSSPSSCHKLPVPATGLCGHLCGEFMLGLPVPATGLCGHFCGEEIHGLSTAVSLSQPSSGAAHPLGGPAASPRSACAPRASTSIPSMAASRSAVTVAVASLPRLGATATVAQASRGPSGPSRAPTTQLCVLLALAASWVIRELQSSDTPICLSSPLSFAVLPFGAPDCIGMPSLLLPACLGTHLVYPSLSSIAALASHIIVDEDSCRWSSSPP